MPHCTDRLTSAVTFIASCFTLRRLIACGLVVMLLLGLSSAPRHAATVSASGDPVPDRADSAHLRQTGLRAVFALSTSASKNVASITGAGNVIIGGIHSNGGMMLGGGGQGITIQGPITYAYGGDTGINFDYLTYTDPPYPTDPQPDPLGYDINDYRPGGSKAVAAGSQYYHFVGDMTDEDLLQPDGTIRDGLYYVEGDVLANGLPDSGEKGTITIAAEGRIKLSGGIQVSAYVDDLLFFSNSSDTASGALQFSGVGNYWVGNLYAPNGLITCSGAANNIIEGSTVGYQVDLSGTANQFNSQTTDPVVTNTNDSGLGSLRQAIDEANIRPGTDTITFNIPGAGPHTISPLTELPEITDPVIIDGTTQPGASCDSWPPTLMIEIDGTNAGVFANGLILSGGSSTVRGLVINRFVQGGIKLYSDHNQVVCNFVGTGVSGSVDFGNGYGILVYGRHNVIGTNGDGSADILERNVISGNGIGVWVSWPFSDPSNNVIAGNYIGTDVTGTFGVGNSVGINVGTSGNRIGTDNNGSGDEAERNIISGNTNMAVSIGGPGNTIAGNYIGTNWEGIAPLPNAGGIELWGEYANDNVIGGTLLGAGNLIAFNGAAGIVVILDVGSTPNPYDNQILRNSIYSNTGLGIDLIPDLKHPDGVTPNDPLDADTGPNNLQNYPVLTAASANAVAGTLNSTPNTTFTLEFYSNTECDPSGYGEGETFHATTTPATVTTDANGDAAFNFTFANSVPPGVITADTTDPDGNTSEFSACMAVSIPTNFVVTTTNNSGSGSLRQAILDANATPGTDTITFNIPGAGPFTIAPLTALPEITDPVIIDGTTQPGASCDSWPPTLMIEIDGTNAGSPAYGLTFQTNNSVVRGLTINRFYSKSIHLKSDGYNVIQCNFLGTDVTGTVGFGKGAGVDIDNSSYNIVGTNGDGIADETERNVISGSLRDGAYWSAVGVSLNIHTSSPYGPTRYNVIAGNYIGTDVTGNIAIPNNMGVLIVAGAMYTRVGTNGDGISDDIERNIISGNGTSGIHLGDVSENIIAGNYIGLNASGTAALGNDYGIWMELRPRRNRIGTNGDGIADDAERNSISGNRRHGLVIAWGSSENVIAGNYIGLDATGVLALGNGGDGILFQPGAELQSNVIGGVGSHMANVIAYNAGNGVTIQEEEPINNRLQRNSIFENGGIGIDLSVIYDFDNPGDGPTPNDPFDADTGPNNLQNYPVLTSASEITVAGTLNSTPNTTFTLEFFSNAECDPSGYGEGETFQATTAPATVTTDASGNAWFSFAFVIPIPAGRVITATATDPSGNTSEFSACMAVPELPPAPTNFVAMPDCDAGRVYFYWDPLPLWPDAEEIRDADTGDLVQRIEYPETQYAYCEDNNPLGRMCGDTISTTNGYRAYYMVVIHEGLTSLPTMIDTAECGSPTPNQPPVNTVPGPQTIAEDMPRVFNTASGNTISISDPDAGANPVRVTLVSTHGTMTLSGTAGLIFFQSDLTSDAYMIFTGTIPAINTALNGLVFRPTANFSGTASLTITTNDQGYTGFGGPMSDTDSVNITISAVNDAPVNTVPGPQTTAAATPRVFSPANGNAISISDPDAGESPVEVTLTVTHGTLTLNGTTGLIFSQGDGTSDPAIRTRGTQAALNTALDGLIYQPSVGYVGLDTLSLMTHDLGSFGSGGPKSDTDTVTITVLPAAAPVLLSPPDGTLTSDNLPTFTWEPVSGANEYRLQVDDDPGFGSPADVLVNETSHTLTTPLLDHTTYSWRVQATNGGTAISAWSAVWTFTIDTARLPAPLLRSPKDHTYTPDTTPRFVWKAVKGAVGYQLQVSDDYDFASPEIDVSPVTPYYQMPPEEAFDYGVTYWRARAQDAAGYWSDWSYTNTVTITILSAPKNAQHLTDTTPTLQWASVGLGATYRVQVDEIGGDFSTPVFEYNGTARSTTTPNLPGGDYQWRAQANAGAGWSVWTPNWTFTVTPPTTLAPVLISPANSAILDTTTPTFTWNPVTNGHIYQIQIAANSTFKNPLQDVTLAPLAPLTYTADPLANGGKYFWRVRAINTLGVAGAWSAKWPFTLNQLVAPILLSPITGTPTTDTTPDLAWNAVSGAVTYELQIDTDRRFRTPDQTLTAVSTNATANPLSDGLYYWRARAANTVGVTGLWSAAWTFIVDTSGPEQPVLSSPKHRAGTLDFTPTLVWKPTKTAAQYRLQVAEDASFTQLVTDVFVTNAAYTIPSSLNYGTYHWRVKAADALGNWGEWSTPFQLYVTILLSPKDGIAINNVRPTFRWAGVSGAVAYHFQLDIDSDFSSPLAKEYIGPAHSYLTPGSYGELPFYWRVRVDTGSGFGEWMPTWTVFITGPMPNKVVLSAPANRAITNDSTPTFSWLPGAYPYYNYQIQIDNQQDFSSPEQDVTLGLDLLTYLADELADGVYYWRVRAINRDNAPGAWSAKWQITIDTVAPPAPELAAPIDGASSTNRMLKLSWNASAGASTYDLRLDQSDTFPLPIISAGNKTEYTPPTPLSRGVYYWQVRALDKAGNVSAWSETRTFVIVAGVTSPLLPTQTPIPTVAPTADPTLEPTAEPTIESTVAPTPEPTTEPTATLDPSLTVIESNDPRVVRTGNWTAHETTLASGGRYLYSSGGDKDTLTLTFTGARVDVIFVKHPALGSFVLVLDDTALQTVSSAASDTEFGARVSLSMGAGRHTLRIVPANGVIAIDAFAVETVIEPPVTPEPTVEPTVTPEPTLPPEPTDESTPDGALPTLTLPVLDTADSAAGWQAKGIWKYGKQGGMQGGGWVADSSRRGVASPLTALVLIDLGTAQTPELRFWQRMGLSSGDLAAVDISLDGGQTWQPLDQQRGHLAEWGERVIDLSAYRGQVIRLRFRLDTQGHVPPGEPTRGWWIDTISVQEASAP